MSRQQVVVIDIVTPRKASGVRIPRGPIHPFTETFPPSIAGNRVCCHLCCMLIVLSTCQNKSPSDSLCIPTTPWRKFQYEVESRQEWARGEQSVWRVYSACCTLSMNRTKLYQPTKDDVLCVCVWLEFSVKLFRQSIGSLRRVKIGRSSSSSRV